MVTFALSNEKADGINKGFEELMITLTWIEEGTLMNHFHM